jgi:hypothetical protein
VDNTCQTKGCGKDLERKETDLLRISNPLLLAECCDHTAQEARPKMRVSLPTTRCRAMILAFKLASNLSLKKTNVPRPTKACSQAKAHHL